MRALRTRCATRPRCASTTAADGTCGTAPGAARPRRRPRRGSLETRLVCGNAGAVVRSRRDRREGERRPQRRQVLPPQGAAAARRDDHRAHRRDLRLAGAAPQLPRALLLLRRRPRPLRRHPLRQRALVPRLEQRGRSPTCCPNGWGRAATCSTSRLSTWQGTAPRRSRAARGWSSMSASAAPRGRRGRRRAGVVASEACRGVIAGVGLVALAYPAGTAGATPRMRNRRGARAERPDNGRRPGRGRALARPDRLAAAASVRLGGRSCAVAAATPLAVLVALHRAGGPRLHAARLRPLRRIAGRLRRSCS